MLGLDVHKILNNHLFLPVNLSLARKAIHTFSILYISILIWYSSCLEFQKFSKTTNKVQGRILNKTFQDSRLLIEVLIENTDEILLRVFIDNKTAQEIGSGIIWLGWDTEYMAILND